MSIVRATHWVELEHGNVLLTARLSPGDARRRGTIADVEIRELQPNEVPAAAEIIAQNYGREWFRRAEAELRSMFEPGAIRPTYWVATESGARLIGVAGYIQSWMDYSVYQLFWVNVSPPYQGRGAGRQLVSRLIHEIHALRGAQLIQLIATERNAGYYERFFGFSTVDRLGPDRDHVMSLHIPADFGAAARVPRASSV